MSFENAGGELKPLTALHVRCLNCCTIKRENYNNLKELTFYLLFSGLYDLDSVTTSNVKLIQNEEVMT